MLYISGVTKKSHIHKACCVILENTALLTKVKPTIQSCLLSALQELNVHRSQLYAIHCTMHNIPLCLCHPNLLLICIKDDIRSRTKKSHWTVARYNTEMAHPLLIPAFDWRYSNRIAMGINDLTVCHPNSRLDSSCACFEDEKQGSRP